MDDLARSAWKEKGVLPAALFGVTCRQFWALHGKRPGNGSGLDRVDELRRHNDDRGRRGEKPTVPGWL